MSDREPHPRAACGCYEYVRGDWAWWRVICPSCSRARAAMRGRAIAPGARECFVRYTAAHLARLREARRRGGFLYGLTHDGRYLFPDGLPHPELQPATAADPDDPERHDSVG